ncbi:F-box/kelch-repeat protein At3g24760 [Olea europaea var. sylvestris]|uniref:F-box kelch-repeat At3g24760 n=1 Tax=Olea europaea subsp. europaea TaxID=158383 RepID=A0A8S0T239_OLEEU|nr:F-box/kelch-repeat protein At3g24760 [Olea europaea var. sylvestris]CAA2999541.1 F-box kelch-repeat At3g24760 [Olea europaea subsp. europaea]
MEETNWDCLGSDLTELILSHLPLSSIIRSSLVCKSWKIIISSSSFKTQVSARKKPWFFIYRQNNVFIKNNQVFAFDPESNEWIKLPVSASLLSKDLFTGSNGFCFSITPENFSFKPVLSDSWSQTSPLGYSRSNSLIGVYNVDKSSKVPRFIVVGGVRFNGNLVDLQDSLAVEIYNPNQDYWELCPPLPADFRPGNSSQWLCSALFKQKFFVLGIYSFFISFFDLEKRYWSSVQTLRPPGALFSYLLSLHDRLILAGLCNNFGSSPCFILWKIDEKTLEFSEMEIMPDELLACLYDNSSDEDDKFASLRCVGFGNLIYVFNDEHHKNYPACVCEMSNYSGKCNWRRLPSLPQPVNKFHKIVSFCSNVSLDMLK